MLDIDFFDETADMRFPPSMMIAGQRNIFDELVKSNRLFEDDWSNDDDE